MALRKLFGKNKPAKGTPADPAPQPTDPGAAEAPKPARVFTREEVEQAVIEVLRTVYDPEIPVNIYEMGLVYDVDVDDAGKVNIRMTLTSPGCPVAGSMIPEIEMRTSYVPGVTAAKVTLVWDPPWDPDMMSEAAKLQLGLL